MILVLIITGASHTGKTAFAQRMTEKYAYPYISVDHLKMGLIRSGNTNLTPLSDDEELTAYLWPIVREIIKTAVENKQNLIVEGCYIPFDWAEDFAQEYAENIRCICLIMSENYIRQRFDDIRKYASVIESRLDDEWYTQEDLIEQSRINLELAREHGVRYLLIDKEYPIDANLFELAN